MTSHVKMLCKASWEWSKYQMPLPQHIHAGDAGENKDEDDDGKASKGGA